MEVFNTTTTEVVNNGLAGVRRVDDLSFAEAAAYLGKHEQTLEYYQKRGWLKPDWVFKEPEDPEGKGSGSRWYTKESLDRFRETYLKRDSELPTFKEISEMYVNSKGKPLSADMVYFHFRVKREIEPKGRRGNLLTFAHEDIERVAQEAQWIDISDIREKIKYSEVKLEDVLNLIRQLKGRQS